MKSNVDKVMERDTRLHDLESRADTLSNSAHMFERRSAQVCKKIFKGDDGNDSRSVMDADTINDSVVSGGSGGST
ncbi:unnamed protein product [Allacma fusca]|uniref:V-SNARE coiled-coil homology domain-containing protein n=1 Tax=Allacma fusca TaxID=39272 RepID=A0A8J2P4P0_9HEXA|nr:unnamed protein product [Allacma fusca]